MPPESYQLSSFTVYCNSTSTSNASWHLVLSMKARSYMAGMLIVYTILHDV